VTLAKLVAPLLVATVLTFLAGCGKRSVSKSQLGSVTGEIVAAAQQEAGRKDDVSVQRGSGAASAALPSDAIYVSLGNPTQKLALQRALAEIAQRHKLSIVEVSSGGVDRFELAYQGTRTHTIRIVTPLVARSHAGPHAAGTSMLAIIVDDLGNDRAAGEAVIALPFPLTVSVLPHLPFSAEIAEEAHRRGDQVLLHLPMQAQSTSARPELAELRIGMNSSQVRSALAAMLETVPYAVGVNNHEGSRATSDPALMGELMPVLRERGLFFIDSRTASSTVAYEAAERSGVAAASRKVFLDDTQTRHAITEQLQLVVRYAARDGWAIAIGHPHPATIAALAQNVPSVESQGVRLVFASDLAH
jgi:uncharacterized protein